MSTWEPADGVVELPTGGGSRSRPPADATALLAPNYAGTYDVPAALAVSLEPGGCSAACYGGPVRIGEVTASGAPAIGELVRAAFLAAPVPDGSEQGLVRRLASALGPRVRA